MPNISAVIATLNEDDTVRNCLETLRWCDEIIVVDNGSSDNTVDIAEEYADNIYYYQKQHGHGDPLQKFGVEKASNDWVIIVDADELITPSLACRLQTIAEAHSADVVEIPFKNYIIGRWIKGAGWWPAHHPRFFHKDKVNVTSEIHKNIWVDSDASVKKLTPSEGNYVYHFNYYSVSEYLDRMNSYTNVESTGEDFSFKSLIFSPVREFLNRFILKKGFRLGFHGLFLSIFQAWYECIIEIKKWESSKLGDREAIKKRYDEIQDRVLTEWEDHSYD